MNARALIINIITNHDLETMENLKDMLKDLAQKDLIGDLEIDLDNATLEIKRGTEFKIETYDISDNFKIL